MAENENGQEKTEEPTAKRLREAREKGQVARSRELNSFLLTVGSAAVFLVFGGQMMLGLAEVVRNSFIIERADVFDQAAMFSRLANAFVDGFLSFVPMPCPRYWRRLSPRRAKLKLFRLGFIWARSSWLRWRYVIGRCGSGVSPDCRRHSAAGTSKPSGTSGSGRPGVWPAPRAASLSW